MIASAPRLLAVRELTVEFETRQGIVRALDDVTLEIGRGEVVAVVGESGSGKSVTAMAIMGILDAAARIRRGRIEFAELDLLSLDEVAMNAIRGRRIAMIFQNPKSSLNPIQTVGHTLVDILRAHASSPLSFREAREKAIELLKQVKITEPARRFDAFPFELSGGMCQRVMIAAALACEPELMIADEPTTALDVTTQAVVMDIIADLCRERGMAVMFVTHDLALASEYSDRIVVMHAGHVVEAAPAGEFFRAPTHPYSRLLLGSIPYDKVDASQLAPLPGILPDLRRRDLPPCRFAERCPKAQGPCRTQPTPVVTVAPDHAVKCHFAHVEPAS